MSVEGLVVLVTGGARGMGREYVRGFVREGAQVVATDIAWPPSGVSNDEDEFLAEIRHPLQWNSEHGHGGIETWGYEPDLAAARAEGRVEALATRHQRGGQAP